MKGGAIFKGGCDLERAEFLNRARPSKGGALLNAMRPLSGGGGAFLNRMPPLRAGGGGVRSKRECDLEVPWV